MSDNTSFGRTQKSIAVGKCEDSRDREGILAEMEASSPVLIVAFGGLAMRIGGRPPFEFFRMLNEHAPTKRLFVRDHHRSWYHRGVRDLAGDISGVEASLSHIIAQSEATKIVMLGTSAGGYAALLFGRLLGATEVHAFAPQTFISRNLRQRHADHRFAAPLSALMLSGCYQSRYGDLNNMFRHTPAPTTRFTIHYCEAEPLDAIHAKHLRSQPGLELRGYREGGHNVVKHLRDKGNLRSLMRQMTVA